MAEARCDRSPVTAGGPKVPGQRPPRPWRALLAAGAERWPLSCVGQRVLGLRGACRAGKRDAFPFPPEGGKFSHEPSKV